MSWLYTIIFAGLVASSPVESIPAVEVDNAQLAPVAKVKKERGEAVQKFEQTYTLNANGKLRLSSDNGSVKLEAWDRNEVKVVYTKIADTDQRLEEVAVRITSRPDQLAIVAERDDWKVGSDGKWTVAGGMNKLRVDFHLMVPRGASLNEIEVRNGSVSASNFTNFSKISVVNGTIRTVNVRGTANLSAYHGDVTAEYDKLDIASKISIETVNAKGQVILPADANATVRADTMGGTITNNVGLTVRKGRYVGSDLYGRLGDGNAQIKLSSVNGPLVLSRRSHGKVATAAVNLLGQEPEGEWEDLGPKANTSAKTGKADKAEKDKADKVAEKAAAKATADAKVAAIPLRTDLGELNVVSIAELTKAIQAAEAKKLETQVRDQVRIQQERLPRIVEASFNSSLPRIEKKTGSFNVKGMPSVTVDAGECGVKIQGWDRSEVKYRVVRFADARNNRGTVRVTHDNTESNVNLKLIGTEPVRSRPFVNDLTRTHIEILVPKKSNLKINGGGEIRLEGVSGDVEIKGTDEAINVRDVIGSMRLENSQGHIRVIGFKGEIEAETSKGMINLEGDFSRLSAHSATGSVILTLPENASADLTATCEDVQTDGIEVTRVSQEEDKSLYRIGKGGAPFSVTTEGEIHVRGPAALKD